MGGRIAIMLALMLAFSIAGAAAWFIMSFSERAPDQTEPEPIALEAPAKVTSSGFEPASFDKPDRLNEMTRERDDALSARDDFADKFRKAEKERKGLEDEAAELKDKLRAAEVKIAELKEARQAPEPEIKSNLRIEFGKWSKMKEVAEADWAELGGAINEMQPLLIKYKAALAKGEKPDAVTRKKIGELNEKLLKYYVSIRGKVPTHYSRNGEFTHAINTANLMAAQLEVAGEPLTAEQNLKIAEFGEEFELRWAEFQNGYNEETYDLKKKLDEATLKEWFVAAMFNQLTPGQLEIVIRPETRGIVSLDLYSAGLMFAGQMLKINRSNEDDLKKSLKEKAGELLAIDDDSIRSVSYLFDDWISELRDQLGPISDQEKNLAKTAEVIKAGQVQLKMMHRLDELLNLSEEQKSGLKATGTIILPHIVE